MACRRADRIPPIMTPSRHTAAGEKVARSGDRIGSRGDDRSLASEDDADSATVGSPLRASTPRGLSTPSVRIHASSQVQLATGAILAISPSPFAGVEHDARYATCKENTKKPIAMNASLYSVTS